MEAKTPCCQHPTDVRDSNVLGKTLVQDRLCRGCGHWWRVDVTCIKKAPQEGGKSMLFHKLEWTHIGKLSK